MIHNRQCLAFLFTLCISTSSFAADSCGKVLASYKGVAAYSNGQYQGTSDDCNGLGADGYQYQCVEYVRRFYREALGIDTSKANGWGGNARDFFFSYAQKGLIQFLNGETSDPPQADDILVLDSIVNNFGHVAIVANVDNGVVTVIEQNWSRIGIAELPLTRDPSIGFWTVGNRSSFTVLGWLRKPSSLHSPFTRITDTLTPRQFHCAVRLNDGKVLLAGGWGMNKTDLASAELYDPATRTFSPTGAMNVARGRGISCALLGDGSVLVAGGEVSPFVYTATAEMYNSANGTFTSVGNMSTPRGEGWTMSPVPGGALLFGGTFDGTFGTATAAVDHFDTGSASFSRIGTLAGARRDYTAQVLADSSTLLVGGLSRFNQSVSPAAELWNASTSQSIAIGQPVNAPFARSWGSAILPNGDVLVISGAGFPAEVYRTGSHSFETVPNSPTFYAGDFASAVSLPNGKILLLGYGRMSGEGGRIAEIFDPTTGAFSTIGSFAVPGQCEGYMATALEDGTVLVTGGGLPPSCDSAAVAEVFNPVGL